MGRESTSKGWITTFLNYLANDLSILSASLFRADLLLKLQNHIPGFLGRGMISTQTWEQWQAKFPGPITKTMYTHPSVENPGIFFTFSRGCKLCDQTKKKPETDICEEICYQRFQHRSQTWALQTLRERRPCTQRMSFSPHSAWSPPPSPPLLPPSCQITPLNLIITHPSWRFPTTPPNWTIYTLIYDSAASRTACRPGAKSWTWVLWATKGRNSNSSLDMELPELPPIQTISNQLQSATTTQTFSNSWVWFLQLRPTKNSTQKNPNGSTLSDSPSPPLCRLTAEWSKCSLGRFEGVWMQAVVLRNPHTTTTIKVYLGRSPITTQTATPWWELWWRTTPKSGGTADWWWGTAGRLRNTNVWIECSLSCCGSAYYKAAQHSHDRYSLARPHHRPRF